jgi:hypothetical protein
VALRSLSKCTLLEGLSAPGYLNIPPSSLVYEEGIIARVVSLFTLLDGEPGSLDELTFALGNQSTVVRCCAVIAASRIKPRPVGFLFSALRDTDINVRRFAVLGFSDTEEKLALPGVLTAMYDEDPGVRFIAIMAIGRLAGNDVAILAQVAPFIADPDPSVRFSAFRALAKSGGVSSRFVPALASALIDPDESVREAAAEALAALTPRSRSPLPSLPHTITANDDHLRIRFFIETVISELVPHIENVRTARATLSALASTTQSQQVKAIATAVAAVLEDITKNQKREKGEENGEMK